MRKPRAGAVRARLARTSEIELKEYNESRSTDIFRRKERAG